MSIRHAILQPLILLFFLSANQGLAQGNQVSGTVRARDGNAISGALVKISSPEQGLTFLVVSEGTGAFQSPPMLKGSFSIQAFAGEFKSDAVEVDSNLQSKVDLRLTVSRPPYVMPTKLTNSDYLRQVPEDRAKQLMGQICVLCHDLDRVVPTRQGPVEWSKTVDRMSRFFNERADLQKHLSRGPLTRDEKAILQNYLSSNLGPDRQASSPKTSLDPDRHLPRQILAGSAAKFRVVEFAKNVQDKFLQKLSAAQAHVAGSFEIAVDSRGFGWVSEGGTDEFGRFDPQNLTYQVFKVPAAKFSHSLGQIAVDPSDNIWIIDEGPSPDLQLVRFNPATNKFDYFDDPAPEGQRSALNTLRFLDGNVWAPGNTSSRIVKLDPRTNRVTDYAVPLGSHPYGIAIGGDRMVWYSAMYDNELVRLDPKSGKQTSFKVPTPRSGLRRMGSDAEGNIWVAEQDANKIAKIDYSTGKVSEYAVPIKGSGPYAVDVDMRRNLVWFAERDGDRIGRFDPRTNTFVEFSIPNAGTGIRRVLVDPSNPSRIWWGCAIGKIGFLEVLDQ